MLLYVVFTIIRFICIIHIMHSIIVHSIPVPGDTMPLITGDTMPLITGGSSMGMQENWATTLYFLICETNSQGFCMSFMHFDLKAKTFCPYPQTEATLMCMGHMRMSRFVCKGCYNTGWLYIL